MVLVEFFIKLLSTTAVFVSVFAAVVVNMPAKDINVSRFKLLLLLVLLLLLLLLRLFLLNILRLLFNVFMSGADALSAALW